MLLKRQVNLFGWQLSYYVRVLKERTTLMYGVGNRCHNGEYVLFLDYDGLPLSWIRDEISLLQSYGVVGHAYIFQTKHGYHVIFLEKMTFDVLTSHLRMTTCDKNYQVVPMEYSRKIWVLRQSPKKNENVTYVGVQQSLVSVQRMKSRAHGIYLRDFMHVPKADFFDDQGYDQEKELYVGYYKIPTE